MEPVHGGFDVAGPAQAEVFVVWLAGDQLELTGPVARPRGSSSLAPPITPSTSSRASFARRSMHNMTPTRDEVLAMAVAGPDGHDDPAG